MATKNQIRFLYDNKDIIRDPVLIVGSKLYEYDKEDIRKNLIKFGSTAITGIDISEGDGVDFVADIVDSDSEFIKSHKEAFNTVICMEVMTNVKNPFEAANNLITMLSPDGAIVLSECYVRKISKMPVDLWRFTYDGTKQLYSTLRFDDSRARISLTRDKDENLLPLKYPLPQILPEKHPDETGIGYLLRRIHKKFFAKGIFGISRLFPETTIYSIAVKDSKNESS